MDIEKGVAAQVGPAVPDIKKRPAQPDLHQTRKHAHEYVGMAPDSVVREVKQ